MKEYSEFIGKATNNEAEYSAVIFALKKVRALFGKKKIKDLTVELKLDTELVVKQVKGQYKIQDKKLQPLFLKLWNLRVDFGNLKFSLVPRQQNKKADQLVNQALNRALNEELKSRKT